MLVNDFESFDVNWNLTTVERCQSSVQSVDHEPADFRKCRTSCMMDKDVNHTMKVRFGQYCLNEDIADVHFVVTEGHKKRKVPAHKFVLAAGSPVFKAMFYGLLSSANEKEIELPDIDYVALKTMLHYLYTDECNLECSCLVSTLYAAKKYQITNLETHCINYLIWNMDNDNVLTILAQAVMYSDKELADLCWAKICQNTKDVIDAESFLDIDLQTLRLFLESDQLAVGEVDLYKAAVRWSVAECERRQLANTAENQRLVLGDVVYKIRFPLMSGDEFAFNVANEDILSKEEKASIFSYFANLSQNVAFPADRRTEFKLAADLPKKELILTRFQQVECGRICMFDQVHKVDFVVLEPIYITGFGIYGTRCREGQRLLNVELTKPDTRELLASARTKVVCTAEPKIYQVRFKVPVPIQEKEIYTAAAEFDGCYPYPTFYGVKGRRIFNFKPFAYSNESVTFIFFKSEGDNFADTGGERGQIPQVLFCRM